VIISGFWSDVVALFAVVFLISVNTVKDNDNYTDQSCIIEIDCSAEESSVSSLHLRNEIHVKVIKHLTDIYPCVCMKAAYHMLSFSCSLLRLSCILTEVLLCILTAQAQISVS
jgi:hypothetical protein